MQSTTDYGVNETVTRRIDLCEIYVIVALNPDGFHLFEMNDYQRKNVHSIDEDEDGSVDEDPPEDLDGDGFIEYLYNTTSGMTVEWEGYDNDNDEQSGEDGRRRRLEQKLWIRLGRFNTKRKFRSNLSSIQGIHTVLLT